MNSIELVAEQSSFIGKPISFCPIEPSDARLRMKFYQFGGSVMDLRTSSSDFGLITLMPFNAHAPLNPTSIESNGSTSAEINHFSTTDPSDSETEFQGSNSPQSPSSPPSSPLPPMQRFIEKESRDMLVEQHNFQPSQIHHIQAPVVIQGNTSNLSSNISTLQAIPGFPIQIEMRNTPLDSSITMNREHSPSHRKQNKLNNMSNYTDFKKKDSSRSRKDPLPLFTAENTTDFKRVVYNLLAEYWNGTSNHVFPIQVTLKDGSARDGFMFNEKSDPDKLLPELYAKHVRKSDLTIENYEESICIRDLYKYYKRSCLELLAKYFIKYNDHTFIYESTPLFDPECTSLRDTESRIAKLGSIQRKHRKILVNASEPTRVKRSASLLDEEEEVINSSELNHTEPKRKKRTSSP